MFRSWSPLFRREFDWKDTWDYPSRLGDQNFGLELPEEDLFTPSFYRAYKMRPKRWSSRQEFSGVSEVVDGTKKFQVIVDVNHFKPEEITVKTVDNHVIVHAKHEERPDRQGFVSREFSRRYILPETVEPESVMAFLSSEGVLKVETPKQTKGVSPNERIVPISMTEEATITTTEKEKETVSV